MFFIGQSYRSTSGERWNIPTFGKCRRTFATTCAFLGKLRWLANWLRYHFASCSALLNQQILSKAQPIPDTPKTLASTSPSGSVSPKIIQKISQGATPGHRTLPLPDIARCDTTTSHPATLSHRTLRHRAISPCHFRLSHPATQKAPF